MRNHYTFTWLLLICLAIIAGCTKTESPHLGNNTISATNSWKDTAAIRRSAAYAQIGASLPQVGYLLQEHGLSYEQAIRAVIADSIPVAVSADNIDNYVDWIILKQAVITCETNWYALTRNYPALGVDTELSKAIRHELHYYNGDAAAVLSKASGDPVNVTFGVAPDGSIGAIMGTGEPITLPEVVVHAVIYDTFFSGSDAPGRGGPNYHPGAALARAREELRRKALKARADFEATARQDQGRRPAQVKGADIVKCFSDGKTAKEYRLTVYVDQPVGGQSDAINIANGDVGHTFIGLEKVNTDASRVSRTFGFYPMGEDKDGIYSKGVLRDNQLYQYDLSITRVFKDQTSLNVLIQKIKDLDNRYYQLYSKTVNGSFKQSFNCTDAAIEMAVAGGMVVPSGFGMFFGPFLPGSCPGKFGEEIRKVASNPAADILGQKSQTYNTKGGVTPQDQGCK
ncbi:hypothetical protein F0L74_27105 [Chitinophaga agrisoli]|uniref:Uncharacterized protein n=1 Tax=Chitinophaga agrisoli TaxID=2607653 RepID=A0A5B2VM95_9BACT|nr:hypothetical protein [Chitinophaga agrisoli]KAA2239858.1 hypothetical protein F0L74_27105 [Chitinophaga agrisoli]